MPIALLGAIIEFQERYLKRIFPQYLGNPVMRSKVKAVFSSAEIGEEGDGKDYMNGYTDVIVHIEREFEEGELTIEKYVASFFTYKSIEGLVNKHKETGEYLKGKYFFAKYMVLIDSWSLKDVKRVIHHLIEEGDFEEVFEKI